MLTVTDFIAITSLVLIAIVNFGKRQIIYSFRQAD